MLRSFILIMVFFHAARVLAIGVPLYDGAQKLDKKQGVVEKHHIALSKNKKIDGRWQFEKELKLSGELIQILFQIETEDTLQNIVDFYQAWIDNSSYETLFTCQSRMCGSSNQWANGHFHKKQLYGPDANQFYWVVKQGDTYWVLYLIERGNKRIYLYAERLQTQVVVSDFKLHIPDNCLIDQAFIDENNILSEDTSFDYLLVVSIAGSNTLRYSQEKAGECFNTLKEAFPSLRLNALGVGEFSSSLDRKVKRDWIELKRLQEF